MVECILIGLILFFFFGWLVMDQNRVYKVSWADISGQLHEMTGLSQHERDVIIDGLNEGVQKGTVKYLTTIVTRDK